MIAAGPVLRSPRGAISLRIRVRPIATCAALTGAALAVSVVAIGTGEYELSPGEVVRALVGHGPPGARFVVETVRLPRALVALLVGGALGVAGAIFQSVSRNPLGSPDIIGFTQGAATAAVLQIVVFGGGTVATAGGAVAGGLATAALVYGLALGHGYRLLLVGIGIGALLAAVRSYLLTHAGLDAAQRAAVWLTGSLNGRGWEHAGPIAAALALLLPGVALLGPRLRILEMGDEAAGALGVPVQRSRAALIAVAAALTAVATAAAGPIAFVALAAPQLARRLTRAGSPDLTASAAMGALLLAASDLAAQRAQLPVGVVTAAIGGTYLIWLLGYPNSRR